MTDSQLLADILLALKSIDARLAAIQKWQWADKIEEEK
jgi:hypothetical protein